MTHYRWHGPVREPVLVAIHGLTTPSMVWDELARGFVAFGFRVLTYNLYGRGYSDAYDGTQDAAHFVKQLEELLADQDVGQDDRWSAIPWAGRLRRRLRRQTFIVWIGCFWWSPPVSKRRRAGSVSSVERPGRLEVSSSPLLQALERNVPFTQTKAFWTCRA